MIVAFIFNLLDEVRPIFASAPIEVGGLGLSTNVLSWPLSFGGFCFILFACCGEKPPADFLSELTALYMSGSDAQACCSHPVSMVEPSTCSYHLLQDSTGGAMEMSPLPVFAHHCVVMGVVHRGWWRQWTESEHAGQLPASPRKGGLHRLG